MNVSGILVVDNWRCWYNFNKNWHCVSHSNKGQLHYLAIFSTVLLIRCYTAHNNSHLILHFENRNKNFQFIEGEDYGSITLDFLIS